MKKVKAVFDKDTKRYHRYNIVDAEGNITGTLYAKKESDFTPKEMTVTLERVEVEDEG